MGQCCATEAIHHMEVLEGVEDVEAIDAESMPEAPIVPSGAAGAASPAISGSASSDARSAAALSFTARPPAPVDETPEEEAAEQEEDARELFGSRARAMEDEVGRLHLAFTALEAESRQATAIAERRAAAAEIRLQKVEGELQQLQEVVHRSSTSTADTVVHGEQPRNESEKDNADDAVLLVAPMVPAPSASPTFDDAAPDAEKSGWQEAMQEELARVRAELSATDAEVWNMATRMNTVASRCMTLEAAVENVVATYTDILRPPVQTLNMPVAGSADESDSESSAAAFDDAASGNFGQLLCLGETEGWLVQDDAFELCAMIGHGSFAQVFRARTTGASSPHLGDTVAVKLSWVADPLLNELRIMRRLHHEHIVRFIGAFVIEGSVRIVMEETSGCTLDDVDPRFFHGSLVEIGTALVYLHSLTPQVVHADVKPANIIVCPPAKLLDFGLSRRVTHSALPLGGTDGFQAPETRFGARPSPAADIYAFGCMVQHLSRVFECSPEMWRIVGECTQFLPSSRIASSRCRCSWPRVQPMASSLSLPWSSLLSGSPGGRRWGRYGGACSETAPPSSCTWRLNPLSGAKPLPPRCHSMSFGRCIERAFQLCIACCGLLRDVAFAN